MASNIRRAWRSLRPVIKDGFTFAETKDLVASAALPVENLSHLQQKSLPAKGASKGDLLDAVDDLISEEDDPEGAIERLVRAALSAKPSLRDTVTETATRFDWVIDGPRPVRRDRAAQPFLPEPEPEKMNFAVGQQQAESDLEIFISHSAADSDLAEALIELIRAALEVPQSRIRCTSVDGYRLPGGVSTDEELQREVRSARVLIALLTPTSLKSPYVLFELGARWGAGLRLIPVLGKGISPGDLRMPLSALNALTCASGPQIHQLVADCGAAIGRKLNPPAGYDKYLRRLLECGGSGIVGVSDRRDDPERINAEDAQPPRFSPEAQELLALVEQEPHPEHRGIVEIREEIEPGQAMFFPRLEYAGEPMAMKSRLFRKAVSELVSAGRLHSPEDNPSTNTRTYEYRGAG